MARTRAQSNRQDTSSENPTAESSSGVTIPQQETLVDRRRRWAALLQSRDYHTVITEVLEQELPKYSGTTLTIPSSLASIMTECVLILASAPLIFTAAVEGSLTRQYTTNADLQTEYAAVMQRAHSQPSIYVHLLADEHGVPPTMNQYMAIQEYVLEYINPLSSNSDLVFNIDNISPPAFPQSSSIPNLRKYLRTPSTPRSQPRVETLERFCAGVRQRHAETPPHLLNTPLEYPPGECGYALNSHKRLSQHRNRQSSNYVMNLVEDICSYLHNSGVFTQRFHMHQFIIYLIFRPTQAEIAEIFCSGLLQVWVENGGGFNHYPAGRSNRSARLVMEEEWREHERYVRENSGLEGNVRVQVETVEERVRVLNGRVAMLWREVLGGLRGFVESEGDV